MTKEEKIMLYTLLIKLSESLTAYEKSSFKFGWDTTKTERDYFKAKLEALKAE